MFSRRRYLTAAAETGVVAIGLGGSTCSARVTAPEMAGSARSFEHERGAHRGRANAHGNDQVTSMPGAAPLRLRPRPDEPGGTPSVVAGHVASPRPPPLARMKTVS